MMIIKFCRQLVILLIVTTIGCTSPYPDRKQTPEEERAKLWKHNSEPIYKKFWLDEEGFPRSH